MSVSGLQDNQYAAGSKQHLPDPFGQRALHSVRGILRATRLCTRSPQNPSLHCREHETKFLVRTLVSNLRVGANWRSVIGAMARAVVMHREGPRVPKARLDAAATAASEAYHVSNADLEQPD